jgi:hypothetical protein
MYAGREYVITDVLPVARGELLYTIRGHRNVLYGGWRFRRADDKDDGGPSQAAP